MGRVTLKDVAEKSGFSTQTVSRVINNLPYVREETKKKIFQAIEELNYRPSVEGKRLASLKNYPKARTNNIGCILFQTYNKYSEPFFSEILEEIDCSLREFDLHNYFTYTLHDLQDQALYCRIINPEVVDGIVLIGIGDKDYQEIKKIRKNMDNLVILADYMSDGSISSVYPDGLDAGYQATKYLLLYGHKRIACITGYLEWSGYAQLRFMGYLKALKEFGVEFDENLVGEGKYSIEEAVKATELILKEEPTAIFVVSDPMAIGVYKAIQENGLKIPDDISVIGCDGIRLVEHRWPPLTTVGINKKEMVKTAIKILIEEIEGKRETPIRVVFPVYLIERRSCRKI